MKTPLLFCLLLLHARLSAQTAAVQTEGMNLVYVGPVNPLTIVSPDVPPDQLLVTASTGELTRLDSFHFEWIICEKPAGPAFLILTDGRDGTAFDTAFFRVKYPPKPVIFLSLPRQAYSGAPTPRPTGVKAVTENFDFEVSCKVLQFTVDIVRGEGELHRLVHNGSAFSDDFQRQVDQLAAGDLLYFHDFTYHCDCEPFNRHEHVDGLIFRIRD